MTYDFGINWFVELMSWSHCILQPISWLSFLLLVATGAGVIYYYDREKKRHIEGRLLWWVMCFLVMTMEEHHWHTSLSKCQETLMNHVLSIVCLSHFFFILLCFYYVGCSNLDWKVWVWLDGWNINYVSTLYNAIPHVNKF